MENSNAQDQVTVISRTGFAYFPIALMARLPFAMVVIGVLTLVVSARGSVELGGFASASVGLGVACCGPLLGAAADRFGQRPMLLLAGAVNAVLLGVLAWVAFSTLPMWAVFFSAFLVGASVPQISPMSRARLVGIISSQLPAARRSRSLSSTFAYESAADEVIFVFGPVTVGLLATAFGAWAPVIGAGVLTLIFVTAFALHPTGAKAQVEEGTVTYVAPVSQLWRPTLLLTVIGILAVGMFFGSMLTSLTAFMQDRGDAEQAGLIYGVMGVGSAIFAVGVAWLSPKFTLRARWLVFALLIFGGALFLQTAHDLPRMILALAVMGIGIGPLLVTLYSFGAHRTPAGRGATVMAMLGTGIMVGQSFTAAVAGVVAEHVSTQASLLLPLLAATIAVAAGVVNWFLTPAGPEPELG
ncbi:MFS family permease [Leucobacter exalbidus]|uniref:MFS family permease n=1 Tax=Leucobacter exalbidus TaxID=662960 RepID=A0A940T321_9MICO|nr:MFS transporter [Leucobacter exalbidus]MBP1325697.1 MFS family permease [Leucobacter exalbidus]